MSKNEEIAEVLEEFATYLRLDGQQGRANGYEQAALSIRSAGYMPPDPSRLDKVGDSIRTKIARYQRSGSIDELEHLKDEYSWYEELKQVDGIGPKRAKQIHEKFNVEDLDDLILVGEDLQMLPRVGPKRSRNILDSAHEVRE